MAEEIKPKSSKGLIIGLVIGIVVAGGGAAGAFLFLGRGPAPASAAAKPAADEEPGPVEKLPSFLVNLRDPATNRYLKATVELELGSDKDLERIKKYASKIRHEILLYLSNLTPADIQGEAGKQTILSDLLARVKATYKAGEVKRVYLTEFVVQ
jgi:flagellar FliL protein